MTDIIESAGDDAIQWRTPLPDIELRWLRCADRHGIKTLQYRRLSRVMSGDAVTSQWSQWRDVPIMDET